MRAAIDERRRAALRPKQHDRYARDNARQRPRAQLVRQARHVVEARQLGDRAMVLMSVSTIRAETEGFVPIDEGKSRFNTSPGGSPFNLYDTGTRIGANLGNTQPGDGPRPPGRSRREPPRGSGDPAPCA